MDTIDGIAAIIGAMFFAFVAIMVPVFIADHHQRAVEAQRVAAAQAWRDKVEHQRMCRDFPFLNACK